MSKEKQRQLAEINRPMNEELFNSIEKQYKEIARVKAESEQIEEIRKDIFNAFGGYAKWEEDWQSLAEAVYNAGYRKQEWISVEERLPTEEENDRGLVGIVNGYNGKIRFKDAIILVDYDFDEKEWWSQDYDLTDCKVECWMPLPEAPKMKGGAE